MKTDDLIDGLTDRLTPVNRGALPRALLMTLLAGLVASSALMIFWLGIRPDLADAVHGTSFWMKFIYTFALAIAGLMLTERLARPGVQTRRGRKLLIVAVAAILVMAILQLAAQPDAVTPLTMGSSWRVCARNIVIVSLPIFAAIFLVMRRFAPTNEVAAGAAAGLLAGGAGAVVYGFHCGEVAAPFVAIWYTLGIALVAALGALLGKAGALRW